MRYPAAEKLEIIRLVEQSHLPVRRTLAKISIPPTTFYRWYDRFVEHGPEGLEDRPSSPSRVWNRIPEAVRDRILNMALEEPELSPRELAVRFTDTEKYFVSEASVYRLLKFGGAKRILFLVDTRNLGKQAHQEFMAYTPPDDGRTFTELYNVQRLAGPTVDQGAKVCISTIQRMYSILSGEPIDESAEDVSLNEVQQTVASHLGQPGAHFMPGGGIHGAEGGLALGHAFKVFVVAIAVNASQPLLQGLVGQQLFACGSGDVGVDQKLPVVF